MNWNAMRRHMNRSMYWHVHYMHSYMKLSVITGLTMQRRSLTQNLVEDTPMPVKLHSQYSRNSVQRIPTYRHYTIVHPWTMPNCYVSVVFERQPNPDEAVEAKEGGKKNASKNRAQEKRYMCIDYLSLLVVTIIWILFLLQQEVGQKTKNCPYLWWWRWCGPFRTPSRVRTAYMRGYCS